MVKLKEYLVTVQVTAENDSSTNLSLITKTNTATGGRDTTFRRSSKKSNNSTGLSTPSPTKTDSITFTYDRIPDSLSSSGFRSRSPSLELKTTIVDSTLNNVNYRECFSCKMPIFHFQEHLFAQDRLWHSDCFTCTHCTRKLDPETFKENNGQPYCIMDYNTLFLHRCYACRKTIPESILPINILKDYYHPECFTCRKCSQVLCPYVHFERNGSFYCEDDFHWLFSPKCATCLEPIRDKTKLTLAMGNTYHEEHFVCFECARPLPGNSFWKKNGVVYCESDYHKLFSAKCDRCLEPIRHDGILALGKKWHRDCCLRCEICDKILREDNYFTEDNKAYCKTDWIKNFAPKCYDCKRPIAEVLKGTAVYALGRNYHPVCFVCQDCNKILDSSSFYPVDNEPYCQDHYHNRTCVDCLKSRSERIRQHEKILKSGTERVKSSTSRRSISPLSVMFGQHSLQRRPKSSQI